MRKAAAEAPRPSMSRGTAATGLLEGHMEPEVAVLPADGRLFRSVLADIVAELGDHGQTGLAITLAIGRDDERLVVPGLDFLAELLDLHTVHERLQGKQLVVGVEGVAETIGDVLLQLVAGLRIGV